MHFSLGWYAYEYMMSSTGYIDSCCLHTRALTKVGSALRIWCIVTVKPKKALVRFFSGANP